ncbi:MAG: DUF502 domain-containing protein [Candidatus Aminicenantes bacterium]|nr:DUF502 domain-containing protein [Candidatus Aminicenantes bacterium]
MKGIWLHIKKQGIRGLLASIPIIFSYLLIRFLYLTIDQRVAPLIQKLLGFQIPGLGLLLILILLYLVGLAASHWAGRQLFQIIEAITTRLPLIKTIYSVGKKLADALSLPGEQAFQRVVLLEYFRPGVWTVAFVTGSIVDRKTGERFLRLFIPTTPNPTSGFMAMVPEGQARSVSWSTEEAIKIVISGGIIGPEEI